MSNVNENAIPLREVAEEHDMNRRETLRRCSSLDHNSNLPDGMTKGQAIAINHGDMSYE